MRSLAGAGLISGAVLVTPAFGKCVVDEGFQDNRYGRAAGCLIKFRGRLLVVRHRLNGKLGVPAGLAGNRETAQCAANRETREEAGVEVIVGPLLNINSDDFHLYRCRPVNPDLALDDPLPVPSTGRGEISEVRWVDPHNTAKDEWRFPQDYPLLLRVYDGLSD